MLWHWGKQGFFSVLILLVSFTVSEGLCGNCLIDSREANSNLDRYKVFSLSSHKTFSWICSNYPWGDGILGLKALLRQLPSALHFTEANVEVEGCTQTGPKSQGERGRGWARHLQTRRCPGPTQAGTFAPD